MTNFGKKNVSSSGRSVLLSLSSPANRHRKSPWWMSLVSTSLRVITNQHTRRNLRGTVYTAIDLAQTDLATLARKVSLDVKAFQHERMVDVVSF